MRNVRIQLSLILIVLTGSIHAFAVDTRDTRMLAQPALGQSRIAFVYAGDLWTADVDGQNVRRLTSDEGVETNPVFSPDGQWIAFNAEYDGNTDVFIIPAEGGMPRRLTWHPSSDAVCDFTPDGSAVLFRSARSVFTRRYNKLYTVPVAGGFPTELEIPNAYKASYSDDGEQLAYTPLGEAFREWKHYRGGTHTRIWLYTFSTHTVEQIPQPEGRCNDTDPMWIGGTVYFLSDRNGEFNLFSYDPAGKTVTQLTRHADFPILSASAGDGRIIYEQAGSIHIYDLASARSQRLVVGVAADLPELRPRYVKGDRYIRDASVSPSGSRAVFEFRGEIVTVPGEKGDPRNLTNSPGAHERSPVWSPDGKSVAYFSDASGEYTLVIQPQDGKGVSKSYKLNGTGFYANPVWSPDSKKISFADNGRTLYWLDLAGGKITKIATEILYAPGAFGPIRGVWSPDSKWIVYTTTNLSMFQELSLYSLEQKTSYPVTEGLSDVGDPVFDKSGKYLYFFASTDAGPVRHWFAMSNADMRMTRAIYLAVLNKDLPSPLAKESDEEKTDPEKQDEKKASDTKDAKAETPVVIDLDGLSQRILALPVDSGPFANLQTGEEGKIYYLEAPALGGGIMPRARDTRLHMYDLSERKGEVLLDKADNYFLTTDGKKLLYRAGQAWSITSASAKGKPGEGKLAVDAIQVKIDPLVEWRQIFDEAWRINRDYFYATNFHGADWPAMKAKYTPFLDHLACRDDLNRVIQWMCSELCVGHHRVGGGDRYNDPDNIPGGLLGADYGIENGRYTFQKVYGGLNWNPDLRSPLAEPGVDVRAGEYLLAVNGKDLKPPENLYSRFENTSGKIVEITVGPNPDGLGSRTIQVVPIDNESNLRHRDWVEGNIRKVDAATDGRVAYVYVPNTTTAGHTSFKRYFFPQVQKDAVIVDERFNGGGQVADYYIDLLRRPYTAMWNMRYGKDLKTPSASIQGPKVMLIDETAGSGGDLLPWMFRKFGLGKLIGKRTWGGLVGTLGFPILMDGGYVTAPNLAIWTEDGGWVVENVGVPPDIEVEQWPSDVIKGHDPQLERAIDVILEELKANPPPERKRPPYPVRVK